MEGSCGGQGQMASFEFIGLVLKTRTKEEDNYFICQ